MDHIVHPRNRYMALKKTKMVFSRLIGFACVLGWATSIVTPGISFAQAVPAAGLEDQIVEYVDVQVALAADDFDQAQEAIDELVMVADDTIAPLARAVAAAEDIETMRARFKPLSEYLASQELPRGFARAYCPMYDGGSNWVQADGPVRNPYFGATMLTCGVIDAAPGAHMDHSPRHGGIVFMAPDSFHHIEGTYPEEGLFRLYATDNYREPVDVSGWSGRVVLEERYDAESDEFVEVRAVDLFPMPDGEFLEAVFGGVELPAEIIAKVVMVEDFPEERFDFIFADYTTEGASPAGATTGLRDAAPGGGAPDPVPLAERVRPDIPESVDELVAEIGVRDAELQALIAEGRFTEIFIPALQGKELGLALLDHADELSSREANMIRIAVRHLVRAAHLLDWYGDLGNRQQVAGAYDVFASSWRQIAEVHEVAP